MKKPHGFTLVEILIVVSVIALLMTILIPHVVRVRLLANESSAQATLKAIAVALENYANDNNNYYPANPSLLLSSNPSYITVNYFSGIYNGYTFAHQITNQSYEITATPVNSNSGSQIFFIVTGGVLRASKTPPFPPPSVDS